MKPNAFVKFLRFFQQNAHEKRMRQKTEHYDTKDYLNIPYIDDGSVFHLLDVHSPKDGPLKRPVILEVHGGGFATCSKEINSAHAKYLATQGFHVVNINYTLFPEGDFRVLVKDLYAAIAWIRKNADKYGFDMDNLFITGDSAGGFDVLLIMAVENSEELQKFYGVQKAGIRKCAATCPVPDMEWTNIMGLLGKLSLNGLKLPADFDTVLAPNSLFPYVLDKCNFPEVFIIATAVDTTVKEEPQRFAKMLEDNNTPCIFKKYEGKTNKLDHVFNVLYPEYEESKQANADIVSYFLAT